MLKKFMIPIAFFLASCDAPPMGPHVVHSYPEHMWKKAMTPVPVSTPLIQQKNNELLLEVPPGHKAEIFLDERHRVMVRIAPVGGDVKKNPEVKAEIDAQYGFDLLQTVPTIMN